MAWIPIREDDAVNPGAKYYEMATLALGREPDDGEDLDPDVILAGKIFVAACGYGKKKGRGDYSDKYAQQKKSDDDFVRVHELTQVI